MRPKDKDIKSRLMYTLSFCCLRFKQLTLSCFRRRWRKTVHQKQDMDLMSVWVKREKMCWFFCISLLVFTMIPRKTRRKFCSQRTLVLRSSSSGCCFFVFSPSRFRFKERGSIINSEEDSPEVVCLERFSLCFEDESVSVSHFFLIFFRDWMYLCSSFSWIPITRHYNN